MNKLFIVFISVMLSGCFSCIDAKFSRDPIPMDYKYVVEFQYKNNEINSKEIHCEKYYDAQCTERGNYWAVRQVGRINQYDRENYFIIENDKGKTIKLEFPSCGELVNSKNIDLSLFELSVNGKRQEYLGMENGMHKYRPYQWRGDINETLLLPFSLSIKKIKFGSEKHEKI